MGKLRFREISWHITQQIINAATTAGLVGGDLHLTVDRGWWEKLGHSIYRPFFRVEKMEQKDCELPVYLALL